MIARRLVALAGISGAILCAGWRDAIGQPAWPAKQAIRIVVPYPPGGSNDIAARAVGEELARSLGQSVLIDNRPGASGAIGMEAVAKSPADGYTFALVSDSVTLLNFMRKGMSWDFEKQFIALAMVGSQPIVVAVHAAQPYKSLQELIAAAKARPGTISYATSGQGTLQHLVGELISQRAGISLAHVPYKGGGQAITDLIGGQVPVGVLGSAPVIPYAKSGKLRLLAQTSAARSPSLPEVATVAESGFKGFDVRQWSGLVAPSAIPKEVLARMRDETAKALKVPAVRERLLQNGLDPATMSGVQFEAEVKTERAQWAAVIKQLGITLQ